MTVKHASACWSLPVHRLHQGKRARSGTIVQPNHLETVIAEVDFYGEPHLVKFSRYHDNQQFWTAPDERDERIHHSKTYTVTEPEPDE